MELLMLTGLTIFAPYSHKSSEHHYIEHISRKNYQK